MPRRHLGTLAETKPPKWSLVLFDWDGCTAIIETKRFENQQSLQVGSKANLSFEGKIHLVEILTLTDSETHVYGKDREWSRGVRALAIAATRDAREMCRKGKYGGFLDIGEESESEEDEPEIFIRKTTQSKKQPRVVLSRLTTTLPVKPSAPTRRKRNTALENERISSDEVEQFPVDIEGDGRRIKILFQGGGETSNQIATPTRPPCYTTDLTTDQTEVIGLQVENHLKQRSSCSTQTDAVVVLSSDQDIRTANARTNVTLTRSKMEVWSTPSVKDHCSQKLDLIQQTQVETNNKLSRLLELIEHPPQEISGLSDYLKQMTTPCPSSRSHGITPADNMASTTRIQKRRPLTAIELFEKENCEPCEGPPSPVDLFSDRPVEEEDHLEREEEHEENKENEGSHEDEVPLSVGITSTDVVTAFTSVNNTIVLNCPSNATIINVNSPKDIVPGNCEFVVNKELQQTARSSACSAGNFLWTMTKILFNEEELAKNMNFSGRKGKEKMSPRRRHSLVHLYVENYDRRTDGLMKAINSVNNGLLNCKKKK